MEIRFPEDLSLHAGVSAEAHQRDKLMSVTGMMRLILPIPIGARKISRI